MLTIKTKFAKYFAGAVIALALVVSSSASAMDFGTSTLRVGSRGAGVMTLQTLVGATADGVFGNGTKAKVMAWQAANGLTADGVFGPMSMAKANASTTTTTTTTTTGTTTSTVAGCGAGAMFNSMTGAPCATTTTTVAGCTAGAMFSATTGQACGTTTTTTTTVNNGPLMGSAGSLNSVSSLSQYSGEEVGEGQKDVKVLGFEAEASNDGDIALKSMKLTATITNASGSTRITDYVNEVSVWMGSTKVATAMASDFSKTSTGVYTKVVSFMNDAVVRADKTEKFYVAFTAPSGFDSGDIDSEAFSLAVNNVRVADGSGVVTTETTGLPISQTVAFVSFSTSADTILKVTADSSNPVAQIKQVDDTNNTDGMVLLKGKLKLEGTSDVTIDAFPVTLVSTGDSISALTGSVTLVIGDKEYTESTGSNCTSNCDSNTTSVLTFNDLDFKMTAGSTVAFTVKADINDTENTGVTATDFDAGDTLKASVLTTNRDAMDVENSQGDQLNTSNERSGSATGEAQTFYSDGINVSDFTSSVVSTANTSGVYTNQTYTVSYKVTAFGNSYYIPKTTARTATTAGTTTQGMIYSLETSAGAVTALGTASASSLSSSDNTVGGYFEIPDGETKTFTATVTVTSPADTAITGNGTLSPLGGYYRIQLESVRYDDDQSGTPSSVNVTPSQNYETADRVIGA